MTQPAAASCGAPGRAYARTLRWYANTESPGTSPATYPRSSTGSSHSGVSLPSGEMRPTRWFSTRSTEPSFSNRRCTQVSPTGCESCQRSWPPENPVTVKKRGDGWQEGESGGQESGRGAIVAVITRSWSNTTSPPVTAMLSRKGIPESGPFLPMPSRAMIGSPVLSWERST